MLEYESQNICRNKDAIDPESSSLLKDERLNVGYEKNINPFLGYGLSSFICRWSQQWWETIMKEGI